MHEVASLDDIAGLDAPHPDVVVVALEHLADAPAALESLLQQQRDRDWRVINLRQVRLASTLASLVQSGAHRMGKVARALQRMTVACELVSDLGDQMQLHWVKAVQDIGVQAGRIARAQTPGQVAQAGSIGRLDAAHKEVCALLDGALAEASSIPKDEPGVGRLRRSCPYKGSEEIRLLDLMKKALLSLRDLNRSVEHKFCRLQRVANHLKDYLKSPEGEGILGLSKLDPNNMQIAAHLSSSIGQLLGQLPTAMLVRNHQQQAGQQLVAGLGLNHARFTGLMVVKSLLDLDEVVAASRPHMPHLPAWHPTVSLSAVKLCDADTMHQRVVQGISELGWEVHRTNALNMARLLDARIVALTEALARLNDPDVIGFLGELHAPDVVDDIEHQAENIRTITTGRLVVSAEAGDLFTHLEEVVGMARAENLELGARLQRLKIILSLTRTSQVLLME